MTKNEFLNFLNDPDFADAYLGNPAIENLYTRYAAMSAAIDELGLGKRVTRITLAGKNMEFHQSDLPQLNKNLDDIVKQLRFLLGVESSYLNYRVRSNKGF